MILLGGVSLFWRNLIPSSTRSHFNLSNAHKGYVIPTKLDSTTSSFTILQIKFSHACSLFGRLLFITYVRLSRRSRLCTTMMPRQTMKMRKIYALDSYAWVDSRRYTQSQGGTTTPSSESKSQEIRKKQQQTYLQSEFY